MSKNPLLAEEAFLGVINGTSAVVSSGYMLWMSESAMLETKISVSQLVSVCIASNAGVPQILCNGECPEPSHPGSSFVVAIAWPSKKVIKNGVLISKQLAQALYFPPVGSNLVMSSLEVKCSATDIQKTLRIQPSPGAHHDIVLHECGKLFLEFCNEFSPSMEALERNTSVSTPSKNLNSASTPSKGFTSVSSPSPSPSPSPSHRKTRKASTTPRRTPSTPSPVPKAESDSEHVSSVVRRQLESSDKLKEVLEKLAARWLYGRLVLVGNTVVIPICGMECGFHVQAAEPISESERPAEDVTQEEAARTMLQRLSIGTSAVPVFYIGHRTSVYLGSSSGTSRTELPAPATTPSSPPPQHLYSALGGLSEEIRALKEIVEHSLLRPEVLTSFGLKQTKGVLLYGPPGTGKTTLARTVASEAGVKMFVINGPEVVSEYYGESEAGLKGVFDNAARHAPSVVFIDELDAITPQRKEGGEELGQRMMATLLTLMDTVHLNRVLVIAATNRPESIDSALRRHGRFDHEIEIGVPTPAGRKEILRVHLLRMKHSLTIDEVETLATSTHGFVGADLSALCNEAALQALRRHVLSEPKSPRRNTLYATSDDFELARSTIRPSAMREVMLEVPKVRWSDVGGREDVKQQLKEIVEWPQKHQDSFVRIGTTPPRGVLLYGPPGCSKTLIARAVAAETGLNFIAVKGPELFSKWVGESEKAVRDLFKRAKAAAPSVIFFDEIDGLAVPRSSSGDGISVESRVMSQLLVEMDGVTPRNGVSIIAATNRPDKLDSALLRPGRFDRLIYVGPPDKSAREEIFRIHLRRTPCSDDVLVEKLASVTEDYTGADIAAVCRQAALAALEEDLNCDFVRFSHFEVALRQVLPSKYDGVSALFRPRS